MIVRFPVVNIEAYRDMADATMRAHPERMYHPNAASRAAVQGVIGYEFGGKTAAIAAMAASLDRDSVTA